MASVTTLPATFVSGTVLTAAQMNDLRGAFRVLQIVQATTASTVTTTSSSYVTSGLSTSITPSFNTSKILVCVTAAMANSTSSSGTLVTIFRGTVAGTNLAGATGFGSIYSASGAIEAPFAANFLDSPATTSATTYTLGMKIGSSTTASAQVNGCTSTITLIEVSA